MRMNKLALGAVLVALFVACGGGDETKKIVVPDTGNTTCDPLMQTGCATGQKCTWIVDATTPQYVGHIGCAPVAADAGGDNAECMFGMPGDTGYDNCQAGFVCSSYKPRTDGSWPAGFCKAICDHQGGAPTCDAAHVCVRYSQLFKADAASPQVAGVCDVACDVFADNDFDGSGANTKDASTKCPGDTVGCYGFPSQGTVPKTGWSCTNDINHDKAQPTGFRHRVQCTQMNGCADAVATSGYTNSCNQGYIPLFYDNYATQTVVCTALCKPANCFAGAGNCGATAGANRPGVAGDSCTSQDRLSKAGFGNGEHCRYEWSLEIDRMSGMFLRSPTSDSVGFCFDHDQYVYDSNNDGMFTSADMLLPACAQLGLTGTHATTDLGSPTTYWGASDAPFGCVDSVTAAVPGLQGKGGKISDEQRQLMMRVQAPRPLYNREAGAP